MKHITDLDISSYYSGQLPAMEEKKLLNHVAQCDFCAGRLAFSFPEKELLTPPPDLCSSILSAAKRISSQKEKQWEFFRYSTKVVLAMGMSLFLLVLFNFSDSLHSRRGALSSDRQLFPVSESSRNLTEIFPSKKTDPRQVYEESLQEQQLKQKKTQEKFLQEQQEQEERRKKREKNPDFKKIIWRILSCKEKETDF